MRFSDTVMVSGSIEPRPREGNSLDPRFSVLVPTLQRGALQRKGQELLLVGLSLAGGYLTAWRTLCRTPWASGSSHHGEGENSLTKRTHMSGTPASRQGRGQKAETSSSPEDRHARCGQPKET